MLDMTDDELKAKVDAYVDEVWEDVVSDITSLVRIRSVEDKSKATSEDPWGPANHEALRKAVEIADRLGLDAHDCDGYIGYADLAGESDRYIATIAHTDVVPEGIGWTVDPYDVTRRDGYLMGRGVLDDKGPFTLSLYAAHFFAREVQRTGQKLPLTLRAIIGSEEETSMGDVKYYLDKFPQPEFCFSPDADFPLICGEKGIMEGHFTSNCTVGGEGSAIVSIEGGTVPNAVCGLAEAVVRANLADLPQREHIELVAEGEGLVRITAHGKGGHASLPEDTLNAIGLLAHYLLDKGLVNEAQKPFFELELLLCASGYDGESLGIKSANDRFGALTIIGGTIHTQDCHLVQSWDTRFPDSIEDTAIQDRLAELAQAHGATNAIDEDKVPFYTDPASPQIQSLLKTYDEYTGRQSEAVVIGGGTYARKFARACAFGPHDPYEEVPAWVGPEHGADEAISEASLKTALKIYIVSIARLMRVCA